MHEMSIAFELLEQVVQAAEQNDVTKVEEIELEVGELKLIVPEAMELAWETVCEGTIADGSRLNLTISKPVAKCCVCSCVFEPEIDNYLCPRCEKADVIITRGNEIILKSLSCETKKENSSQ